jgi:23S rRNA (uracil1939-C5)-methyltransferase
MSESRQLRIGRPVYGGTFLTSDPDVALPFVCPDETVEVSPDGALLRIVEPSAQRVAPRCPHFGSCGGCQYQMIAADEQLTIKQEILRHELHKADVVFPSNIAMHSAESYGYRNRIRLRLQRVNGVLRFGYNVRGTTEFLPITTCPISAPLLVEAAEALLALAADDRDAEHWLNAAVEVEVFVNDDLSRLQLTLFCAPRTKAPQGSFTRMMNALQRSVPQLVGGEAAAFDPRTGPTGRTLATHGSAGLSYKVGDETYWVSRGGFFQVNRFMVETLVRLVCEGHSGGIAWDLFAGVGLFSRVLARSFTQVTAVEASPVAAADLRAALGKIAPAHRTVEKTTLEFLREAVVQRERPEWIVLDPPRAGAGEEVCALLARIAAPHMVYVSCDPVTLARDLRDLQSAGYKIGAPHLVDLFPQTFHMETVVVLERG